MQNTKTKKINNFIKLLKDIKENPLDAKKYLEYTFKKYRANDPGNFMYYDILLPRLKKNSTDYPNKDLIRIIYITLCTWNMNTRGAKLSNLSDFQMSLRKYRNKINKFRTLKLKDISLKDYIKVLDLCEELFDKLELVNNEKNKSFPPKLVTYSKTLHFLLPNLFVPIDRKFTLAFFNMSYSNSNSYKIFKNLHLNFFELSCALNCKTNVYGKYTNTLTIPKLLDNLIIGYMNINYPEKFKSKV